MKKEGETKMNNTVINVFEKSEAEKVVAELEKDGFARKDISVVTKGADTKNLIGKLTNESVPEEEAKQYVEEVSGGKTLVYLKADDNKAQRAVAIMERYSAAHSAPAGKNERGRTGQEGEVALPVMEEQLQVGKREVERGGVRVHSRITEKPVEETVTLREEHVNVERRPADRAVSEADMAAMRGGTIELTETSEEAVVSKQARVVEEVVVGKDVQERTETVRDAVRRTDVDVEQLDTNTKTKGKGSDK
ncbi:MAG: DUF2382 domain-containing protein [Pyrinomonadaceae bacterium]|nr:DUF2382 domain-containing protein [Pyrinomonadaceae bacterium]